MLNIDFLDQNSLIKNRRMTMIFKEKNDDKYDLNNDIMVDLWPCSQWSDEELDLLLNIFNKFGKTSGQLSSGSRGGSVQIGIEFISSIVAAAFFGALAKKLGDETYDYLKNRIQNIFLKKGSNNEALDESISSGYISIGYPDEEKGLEFRYTCNYNKEEQLDIFLSSLNHLNLLIYKAHKDRKFPFDMAGNFSIRIDFNFYSEPNFKITIDSIFHADVKTISLDTTLKWEEFKWIKW